MPALALQSAHVSQVTHLTHSKHGWPGYCTAIITHTYNTVVRLQPQLNNRYDGFKLYEERAIWPPQCWHLESLQHNANASLLDLKQTPLIRAATISLFANYRHSAQVNYEVKQHTNSWYFHDQKQVTSIDYQHHQTDQVYQHAVTQCCALLTRM